MTLRLPLCAVLTALVLLPLSSAHAQRKTIERPAIGGRQPARNAAPKPIDAKKELAALPKDLQAVLQEWYESSRKIEKLHGEHCRFIYNYTFGVEERAVGKFYYEAPSRGRIDLAPKPGIKKDTVFTKKHPETGKAIKFKVKPETEERWICDGKQILVIDDPQKTVQQFPIPKAAQGINIMDGPLPFLFGMPPEKAVARFKLRLESMTARHFDLLAVPRWQQDVANYKWARIRIERKTMLPMAVQMLDTARTRETVYTFPKVEKNPKPSLLARGALFQKIFGSNDPFRPNLKGYDIQVAAKPGAAGPPGNPVLKGNFVPSVIGLDYKQAEQVLKARGYTVKFYKGEPAINADLKFKVANQNPKPREPGENGQLVKVTLYTEPVQQTGATAPKLPTKPVTPAKGNGTPNVVGLPWTEAEKVLKARGLTVKFRRGRAAIREGDVFRVYDQSPKEGTAVAKGETIYLTLFTKPGEKK